jgi:hypothetical protein
MSDRRITPANGRVAHVSLRGTVAAARFVDGEKASVIAPLTDLLAAPGGARDRQLLRGDGVLVLDRHDGFAFLQSEKDGYCGYVAETALGDAIKVTHWLRAPASHLYPAPNMKLHENAPLSFGAKVAIVAEHERFFETDRGEFVPRPHLCPVGTRLADPASVAEMFLGTPYLWGGNSRAGLDCSGLVQAALLACGIACPGDSDLQQGIGSALSGQAELRRGDLVFWKGHVAMALDVDRLIHANAFRMAVTVEGADAALTRIAANGDGTPTAFRRPPSRPGG